MKLGIYSKLLKSGDVAFVRGLISLLLKRKAELHIYKPYYHELVQHMLLPDDVNVFGSTAELKQVDFLMSLGGDGTLLDTIPLVQKSETPVLGINIGRLGFLTAVGKTEVEGALNALQNNDFTIENRSLIRLDCNPPLFGSLNFALNEFTIHKKETSSMVTVHVYVDGNFLNSYWADGLIVATPTGSTAYSLSCGGPIVHPDCGNFVITPVAPHNLTVRPIVIPDTATIDLKIEGRAEHFLCTLDSRFETIDSSHLIKLRKADFCFKLVRLKNANFFGTIRNKLKWGLDSRN